MSVGLHARPRSGAWRGDAPRDTVVFAAAVAGLAFAVLTPAHVLLLHGAPRTVMPLLSAASCVACLVLARATRDRQVPDRGLPDVLTGVATLPLLNSLVHLAVTRQIEQTAVLMLAVVALGAVVERGRAVLLAAVATAAWMVVLVTERLGPPRLVVHYAFGLALALLLAFVVHQIRARSEQRLRAASADLDAVAAVARCGHTGADARPVTVQAVQRLARATAVSWVEADGGMLQAVCCAGVDVTGMAVRQSEARLISRCLLNGQRVFVPAHGSGLEINQQLLRLTGSTSVLCEPVIHDGSVLAVLVVGWERSITDMDDHAVTVVSTMAAEAGASVSAARLRTTLQSMATTDPMTGIHNRRGWNEQLDRLTATARRTGRPLTLALADIDHFKRFNDTYGHDAGDVLLQGFATAARALLRDVDVICRWGGEEFAFALPDCTAADACEALDRLRLNVPDSQTSSFGLAVWHPGQSVADCMVRADAALYRAKSRGRDRVCE